MTNYNEIVADIKKTVEPLMANWVEDRVAYIMSAKKIWADLRTDPEVEAEYKAIRAKDRYFSKSSLYYYTMADKGYTKGDVNLAVSEGENAIRTKMEKEAANKLAKIDVAVAKKINFDVNSVEKLYFNTTGKDGFVEGAWKLNNEKTFYFETFYAGGYNIQCFHVRTKYKLKG